MYLDLACMHLEKACPPSIAPADTSALPPTVFKTEPPTLIAAVSKTFEPTRFGAVSTTVVSTYDISLLEAVYPALMQPNKPAVLKSDAAIFTTQLRTLERGK
jgi:hypothetical protein